MQQWKSWARVLFAVVLSLGLVVGMAAADPPPEDGDHPGCENSGNQPKGCEDDGHPDDPGDDEDDEDDEDTLPTAPVGDACHQVIDEAVANGAPPEFEEGRQVCDALGGSHDDDGDDGDDDGGEDGDNPVGDGCHEVVDEAVANGAPPELEEGRQVCDALGGSDDDDDDGDDDGEEPGEDEDPLAPVIEGCHEVIDQLVANGAPPEVEQARALCDALGGDGGGEPPAPPEDPLAPVGEGCHEVIDQLVANGAPPEVEQARALCDALSGDGGGEPPAPPADPTGPVADGCDEVVTALADNVDPALEDGQQVCDAVRDGGGVLGLG